MWGAFQNAASGLATAASEIKRRTDIAAVRAAAAAEELKKKAEATMEATISMANLDNLQARFVQAYFLCVNYLIFA